jgi:soluble lytic murein transglycosylase-like protein
MLLGCIALTVIVLAGLPKVGVVRKIDLHSTVIGRVFAYPLGNFRFPPLAQPQKPQVSTFRQELGMSSSKLMNRWDPFVAEASRKFGISESWIKAVMRVETGGRTVLEGDHPITSHAGAMGLMQLMHGTYNEMRAQYGLGRDPFNPRDNVFAAAGYLRWLYKRYGFPNMFAAYNGGPGKLEDHLANGAPLPDETVNYIASVTQILGKADQTIVARADGGRHHRNLRLYASLTPHRGRRVSATLGG